MRSIRTIVVLAAVPVVLAASGCGSSSDGGSDGGSDDASTAVASLTTLFTHSSGSASVTPATKRAGACMARHLVDGAGVARLRADKVLTASSKAAKTFPTRLSTKSATAYADAYLACYDIDDFTSDIQKQTKVSRRKVERYAACVHSVSDAQMRRMIIDEFTATKPSAAASKVERRLQSCYKTLGG